MKEAIALFTLLLLGVGFYIQTSIALREGRRREKRRLAMLPLKEAQAELLTEWAKQWEIENQ